jgi:hypothetical protein
MRRLKWWEWGVILLIVLVLLVIFTPALARSREASRRASCQNNMKQFGLVVKMYMHESRGERSPPLSPIPGNWMADMRAIYPEYCTDLSILICPQSAYVNPKTFVLKRSIEHSPPEVGSMHPDCVSGLFYNYVGHAIASDEQAVALYEADQVYGRGFIRDRDLELPVPVWKDSGRDEDAGLGSFPVLWDRLPPDQEAISHIPPGINVLHYSGAVTFVRYSYYNGSNNFPATWIAGQTFGSESPRLSIDCY